MAACASWRPLGNCSIWHGYILYWCTIIMNRIKAWGSKDHLKLWLRHSAIFICCCCSSGIIARKTSTNATGSSVAHAKVVLFCRQLIFLESDVLASPSAFGESEDLPTFKVVAIQKELEKDGKIRKRLERPEVDVSPAGECSCAIFQVCSSFHPLIRGLFYPYPYEEKMFKGKLGLPGRFRNVCSILSRHASLHCGTEWARCTSRVETSSLPTRWQQSVKRLKFGSPSLKIKWHGASKRLLWKCRSWSWKVNAMVLVWSLSAIYLRRDSDLLVLFC